MASSAPARAGSSPAATPAISRTIDRVVVETERSLDPDDEAAAEITAAEAEAHTHITASLQRNRKP